MSQSQPLRELFPREDSIPAEFRPPSPIEQRSYLIDGELRTWKGECQAVLSPVCLRAADGTLQQVVLGSYPVIDGAASDAALDAAVRAYDNGRGDWPTLSVGERIGRVEDFTRKMVAQRRQIVHWIMWEIGKSLADSEKEFDRTVEYINATLQALKELDNRQSRFEIVEGTIGQIRRAPLGVPGSSTKAVERHAEPCSTRRWSSRCGSR